MTDSIEITTNTQPILSDEQAFLAAINANPNDIAIRLVFADWLDEQGDTFAANYQRNTVAKMSKDAREAKYAGSRRRVACDVAEAYHKRIADLYTSKHAAIQWGRGGEEQVEWGVYAKSYKYPCKYRNAGVRVIGYRRSGRIVLENSRGKEVARLPMPPISAKFGGTGGALLGGDLYCTIRTVGTAKVATRYGVNRKGDGYTVMCLAVQFAVPEFCREQGTPVWGVFCQTESTYWEHGSTIAECRAEYERKLALADTRRREQIASDKQRRRVHLIGLLCRNLPITRADSYAAGNCTTGTEGFVSRFFAGRDTATAGEIRATLAVDPSNRNRVESVIERAAKMVGRRIHLPVLAN